MKLNQILLNPSIPDDITVALNPHDYQLEDLDKLLKWQRCSNYSEVGTGKSLVSYLYIMSKLYEGKKVLVIQPPPLLIQYARNFNVIQNHPFSIEIIEKDRGKRHSHMDVWDETGVFPDVLMMGYQLFVKYFKYLNSTGKYQVLVADEAHALSNAATKTFQAFYMSVYSRNMNLLTMTATPVVTELRSAYGHIKLKTPEAYTNLDHFDRVHTVWRISDFGKVVDHYQNVAVLETHLNNHSVRRIAADVLSLEDPTINEMYVHLSPKHFLLYRTLLEEHMLELGDEVLLAKNQQALRQMALRIITNLESYTEDKLEDNPLDTLKEIVDSIPGKVAVFVHFKATVKKLNRVFHKLNPALVYGDSHVQGNVDKFLDDPTCRIAILNYQSGGAGINLQSVCSHVIFFEATGSPGQLTQALGRVHRQGQTQPVVAWLFNYSNTKSSKLFGKAFDRSGDIKIVMDDKVDFVDHLRRDLGI